MHEYDYPVYVESKLSFIDLLTTKLTSRMITAAMWDPGLAGWLWS